MAENTMRSPRRAFVAQNLESTAWKWMRYSGFLLIPLAWGHIILQDVVVGVHNIDANYVAVRWANVGWRIYDALLLAFAFAHGVNGLRQVLTDFIHTPRGRQIVAWVLFFGWLAISIIGATAIVGGVRQ